MNRTAKMIAPLLVAVCVATQGGTIAEARSIERPTDDSVHTVALASAGNELKYAPTEFTVKAGEKVRLTFENKATIPGISHNVVILALGADSTVIQRVGIAALQAADSDYIPKDDTILFHTSLAAPGETVEVTFDAPSKPGEYPFLCTFPGHFVTMHGVMTVTGDQ